MIVRPWFNWLFPLFRPLDRVLLEILKERLAPKASDVLSLQLSAVNFVQHVFGEVLLYEVRRGRLVTDRMSPFPIQTEELHLASAKVTVPASGSRYCVEYWLVKGCLFSIEISPQPQSDWSTTELEVQEFTLHHDPLKPEEAFDKVRVFVALGSNQGDSVALVRDAISWLGGLSLNPVSCSGLWHTTPVGCPRGSPPFINAVAALTLAATETPEGFLEKLKALETQYGRRPKKIVNEPRPLDLDLIAFGNETRNTPELTLPHPRAHLRRFVLQPLSEIAPDLVLPGQSRTVAELLSTLDTGETLVRLAQ